MTQKLDYKSALKFCSKNISKRFYQPIVFVENICEIEGKWDTATKLLARQIMKNIKGKTVLDCGCNYGYFLHESKRNGASQSTGIDNDPEIIRLAIEIDSILNLNVNFIEADLDSFELNESYDLVLLLNVLHCSKDPLFLVKKCLDLTKEVLVIEHEDEYFKYFPTNPSYQINSPRCAGQRYISIFQKSKSSIVDIAALRA